ncbi:hypothetical protein BB561_002180 [Smittium simulii]|uniref:FAM50A/XAP5 C-terminal domain-containing protein n=1 Tax=Smittium simulii TaxID=133385 RepID=A0A2T9YRG7_9FUNG|nr:hypothetical protein BB561_002180 [Smittium simulii]
MAEYKGAGSEKRRQDFLSKQRDKQKQEFEKQKLKISKDSQVKIGAQLFVSQNSTLESKLKEQTIGLVKLEDFQRIHKELEEEKLRQAAKTLASKSSTDGSKKSKRKSAIQSKTLSFDSEEVVEGIDSKKIKLGKDPNINTSFLPDKERDELEKLQREQLRQEWLATQNKIKSESVDITYSYWDGSGHRKSTSCLKGDTIATFLGKCKLQNREIRGTHVENLLFIKEDLIIPHHYTFYDFIINKVRGKSGPLFSFEAFEDVRAVNDARVEKVDSHVGKVCERQWYERNKHIFPANRWEIYDQEKDYGKYLVKDLKL